MTSHPSFIRKKKTKRLVDCLWQVENPLTTLVLGKSGVLFFGLKINSHLNSIIKTNINRLTSLKTTQNDFKKNKNQPNLKN